MDFLQANLSGLPRYISKKAIRITYMMMARARTSRKNMMLLLLDAGPQHLQGQKTITFLPATWRT